VTAGEDPAGPEALRTVLGAVGFAATDGVATPVPWATDGSVYRVEDAEGRPWALRIRPSWRLAGFHAEQAAMQLGAAVGVPVPAVRATGVAGAWSYMLCAWAEGATVGHLLRVRPELAERLGQAMGETQARVHCSPPPRWRGDWLDRGGGGEGSSGASAALPDCLVHLDFHPLNLLWHDGRLSAVLDWANAGGGDPRLDVARTRALFAVARAIWRDAGDAFGRAEAAWRRAYEADHGVLADMEPFLRWAARRTARDVHAGPAVLRAVEREAERPW
jgi:aminoglycoside phosphotransferase (APT) family kinase protein